jgi:hypothetical protein
MAYVWLVPLLLGPTLKLNVFVVLVSLVLPFFFRFSQVLTFFFRNGARDRFTVGVD